MKSILKNKYSLKKNHKVRFSRFIIYHEIPHREDLILNREFNKGYVGRFYINYIEQIGQIGRFSIVS